MKNNQKVKEDFIEVDGGRIWYKIIKKENKNVPLLIVHGGPGASWDYLEPLEKIADERPVIFYDQLGCGNSDKSEDKSLWKVERFADEIGHIRKALDLKKIHILGQSWGASVAVDYMLNQKPEGVKSLILSAPLISVSRWIADQKKYISKLPEHFKKTIEECEESGNFSSEDYQNAMMEFYKIHLCRLSDWPECLNRTFEKLNASIYNYMWGASEFSVTGTLKDYERADRLKEIKIPVLFTVGRYDECSPEAAEYYQTQLPGSSLNIFEDASHSHHIEKQDEYLKKITNFIKSAEGE